MKFKASQSIKEFKNVILNKQVTMFLAYDDNDEAFYFVSTSSMNFVGLWEVTSKIACYSYDHATIIFKRELDKIF